MPVMVDVNDDAMQPSGKMERVVQAGDDFRNGFPGGFRVLAAGLAESQENRSFSWRSAVDNRVTLRLAVSPIVRRAARSRVRLTDRAFVLKESASDTCSSLS